MQNTERVGRGGRGIAGGDDDAPSEWNRKKQIKTVGTRQRLGNGKGKKLIRRKGERKEWQQKMVTHKGNSIKKKKSGNGGAREKAIMETKVII